MRVYHFMLELTVGGWRVYSNVSAYLCIAPCGIDVCWVGCLYLCMWSVGICVCEYIFEHYMFLYPVLFCVCGLWRSVSLGDTVCVSSQIACHIHTFPNQQGRQPEELRGAICEGTFCLSVGGGDELIRFICLHQRHAE